MAAAGGFAVRLLHAGVRHEPVRRAVPSRPARAVRPDGARRQSVPLHRLSPHPRCRPCGRSPAARLFPRPARPVDAALEPVEVAGFSRPRSVDDCLAILAALLTRALIAGGSDLGVESEPARPPLATSCQRRSDRRAARMVARRDTSVIASARRCRSATSDGVACRRPLPFDDVAGAVRVAADPQPRHAWRQSGHRIAHRRRRAAAAGARRLGRHRRRRQDGDRAAVVVFHAAIGRPPCSPASCSPPIEIPKPLPRRPFLQDRETPARRHQHGRRGHGHRPR